MKAETTTPIQRSNPQNVPLDKLEGKRLLSVQEADALQKRKGLPESDPELFMWGELYLEFYPDRKAAKPADRTYATTRPEGHYVLGYIVSHV